MPGRRVDERTLAGAGAGEGILLRHSEDYGPIAARHVAHSGIRSGGSGLSYDSDRVRLRHGDPHHELVWSSHEHGSLLITGGMSDRFPGFTAAHRATVEAGMLRR